jgi:H+/Cl- antiporter ClcA
MPDPAAVPSAASPDPAHTGSVAAPDPAAQLRSASYVRLLLLAALVGAPVSVAAYYFLNLIGLTQRWVFTELPHQLGFTAPPLWWPLPLLVISGVVVALAISRLPGNGGHSPADGFSARGTPSPADLPGILLAALAGLGLGVVLGPEAPLIALGGGLGICAVRLSRRDAHAPGAAIIAAAGSFAAISALMGSPILGAFLLMEATGLGGATLGLVLLPGLLASGIGSLVFIGLNSLTGLPLASLSIPGLAPFARPDIAQFGYALVIGVLAALLGTGIRRLAWYVRPHVDRHRLVLTPVVGFGVGCLAIGYAVVTGRDATDVLFSGQNALGPLLVNGAGYTVGALVVLLVGKSIGYGLSMSAFRGGPVFPSMFLGAAGGLALSHLPGLPSVAGAAMGIGAMSVVMLRLPMTAVLLATLLLLSDGLTVMPLVIVAVVVAHVVTARLEPAGGAPGATPGSAGSAPGSVPTAGNQPPEASRRMPSRPKRWLIRWRLDGRVRPPKVRPGGSQNV